MLNKLYNPRRGTQNKPRCPTFLFAFLPILSWSDLQNRLLGEGAAAGEGVRTDNNSPRDTYTRYSHAEHVAHV